ncbi:hypothetical protein EOA13_00415 [Mesorhizobium sp. M7A.F.Ca.US.011.01.1.1]|uniref:hypothetical protein n=1 Tax=Mesorhizobium sp. M7A.F.Ca.US.011.01.1.1 TaxID=2496741 RepID=UPI000FCB58BC|nr:hypothetical protein [Mesorhizobium sp. M7A.F.Ca.US.011.01.1.1]RUX32606.1 hypothetical protein EOA13_00415 [Mesorhizobium sp. M7A.F.Ca.US.011.01.1.1]
MSVRTDPTPFILTADQLADDFIAVARLAGVELSAGAVNIEKLPAPHVPPTRLPPGRMAVYVFALGPEVLKVGKVGAKSQARYTSQHYNAGSALSTLAASILAERERHGLTEADMPRAGQWIRHNVDRVNFLIDEEIGMRLLNLLEAFLQCRLNPRYEGFKSQSTALGWSTCRPYPK